MRRPGPHGRHQIRATSPGCWLAVWFPPTSHAGLAWAMAGVSVNTEYIRRYPPKEMKCDGIMLGKFKGLLLPPSQIATSQPGRVTSEVRSKWPMLCFCESKYDTRTLWAGAAGPVPAAAPPYRPPPFSPLRWQPGVAQPGQLASFIWDRRRAGPPPRGTGGGSPPASEVGTFSECSCSRCVILGQLRG